MARRPTPRGLPAIPVPTTQCAPSGSTAAPPDTGGRCPEGHLYRCATPRGGEGGCPTALRRADVDGQWIHVDANGASWVDDTPTLVCPDGTVIDMHELDAWDRLAKHDIGQYSALKAYLGLGGSFYHQHSVGSCLEPKAPHKYPPVPECHSWPMWHRPGGWQCRIADTFYPYAPTR